MVKQKVAPVRRPFVLGALEFHSGAVLKGFVEMIFFYVVRTIEVGDGAGDFDDAVIGAGGEVEAFSRLV